MQPWLRSGTLRSWVPREGPPGHRPAAHACLDTARPGMGRFEIVEEGGTEDAPRLFPMPYRDAREILCRRAKSTGDRWNDETYPLVGMSHRSIGRQYGPGGSGRLTSPVTRP